MTTRYDDPQIITEADIDDRPRFMGYLVTEPELMTADEWWSEFRANICCTGYTRDCACGGYTDELPSDASRLLKGEEDDF